MANSTPFVAFMRAVALVVEGQISLADFEVSDSHRYLRLLPGLLFATAPQK